MKEDGKRKKEKTVKRVYVKSRWLVWYFGGFLAKDRFVRESTSFHVKLLPIVVRDGALS